MPRFVKIILWTFGSLLFLLLVLLAIIPNLLSTSWGKQHAVDLFNRFDKGTLQIEELQLNLIGSQKIEGLEYVDKDGKKILALEHLKTETSLLYLLFGGRSFGETEIQSPYLLVKQEVKEKKPKKEKKKKKKNGKDRDLALPLFEEKIEIHDGTLIFQSEELTPITISNIKLEKKNDSNSYLVEAETKQDAIQGKVRFDVTCCEKVNIKGEVTNFPVAIFDQLDHSTWFTDAIGKTLDIQFDLYREPNRTITLATTIKSQNLNGKLTGETRNGKLYLDPDSQLAYTLTPRFFKTLLPESQKESWNLARNTNMKLQINEALFPLTQGKPAFEDVLLQARGSVERAEISHSSLGSYSFNNFTLEVTADNQLELKYSGEIQGKEPSSLNGTIFISSTGDVLFKSNFKGFPVSLLSLISPPVEKNTRLFFGQFFDLSLEGRYRDQNLLASVNLSSTNLKLEGTIEGMPDDLAFDVMGKKTLSGTQAAYMGSSVDFQFKGIANLSREGGTIPLLNGRLSTPYYDADIKGSIGERGQQLDFHETELVVTGTVKELPYKQQMPTVQLKNGGFFINVDGPTNTIVGQAFVNTQVQSDKGVIDSKALEGRFELKDYIRDGTLDFKQANLSFSTDLTNFPLVLLNPLVPGDLDISKLFGNRATIKATGSYTPTSEQQLVLNFNGKGEGVDIALSIAIDGTLSVTQNQPAYIRWELTPERYQALITSLSPDRQPLFQLTKPAQVELSIRELTCPSTPPEGASQFLCQTGFVGDLKVGTLTFRSQGTQEYLVIREITGSVKGENFSKAIDLNLRGDILAHNVPQNEQSSFEFKGVMVDFWTPEGQFNREGLAVDGELSLNLLPVRQATEIYPLDSETKTLIQAVLGELVNARIYGRISQMTGPLTVDVKSSNFKAKLPILLNPHAIYLRDYVDAEITITPEVNQTLLKDINPLLIAGAYSDHPIRLFIEPQGFVLPIRPYNLQGVQIGKAIIDIGKIRVRNGGQIQKLMTFLKAKDVTPEGDMNAWFTPIFMSLQNGEASYKRFDMLLANEFHIALWGSINLISGQVRMTLGIAPSTLKRRFNISGLSDTQLFQVKMRGTTSKLDLDWSAASTRIGLLVTKTAGGLGALIGGILETIVGDLGEEPSPPPTTSPFPWASQQIGQPSHTIPQEAPPQQQQQQRKRTKGAKPFFRGR